MEQKTRAIPSSAPKNSSDPGAAQKKIGILVVAYNAASTLASVLDRIPEQFRSKISEILVCDDHSQDSTYLVSLGYQQIATDLPITVIRQPRNLGYGGNQKAGYQIAIERGFDIIVLLHGDGQYAPEYLPHIVAPLERDECDAVFGSRMLERGSARKGGMPFYKFVGNRILTSFENAMLGTKLSEFHSGYRAYRVGALAELPVATNSDGFNFDTQIIVQLHQAGMRISEVPIPTYYGDEICYVNGLKYARDVVRDVTRYRLGTMGFGTSATITVGEEYRLKQSDESSHGKISAWVSSRSPCRILDLGCSGGQLSAQLAAAGHSVTGVDAIEIDGVRDRVERIIKADLDEGIPIGETGRGYDLVLAADLLEHLRKPERLLEDVKQVLKPGGRLVVSIPNIGHWYPRLRILAGRFDYDQRGILDETHLRFFTRRSFRKLAGRSGFRIRREAAVGLPFDVISNSNGALTRVAKSLDRVSRTLRPTLFGYQFVLELEPVQQNL